MKQNTIIIALVAVAVVVLVIRYFINRDKQSEAPADLINVRGELTPLIGIPVTSRG